MSSPVQKQFEDVKLQLLHGNFKEALSLIDRITKIEGIGKEEQLKCLILKSDAVNKLGNHREALQIVEEVLRKSKGLDNPLLQLDALIIKAEAIDMLLLCLDEIKSIFEKGWQLVLSLADISIKKIAERKARLLHREAWRLSGGLDDLTSGLALYEQALAFAKESENSQLIARSLVYLGVVSIWRNDQKKARSYLEKALKIAESIGNKLEIAYIFVYFGFLHLHIKRDLEEALKLFQRAVALHKEIESTYLLPGLFFQIGLIYIDMSQFDKALEYFQSALKLDKGKATACSAYRQIGYIYCLQNELDKAQEYYMKSLKMAEEEKFDRKLSYALSYLIELLVEMNNLEQAQEYLERLEQISNETEIESIIHEYLYASILVLKASTRMQDWIKAVELLNKLLAKTFSPWFRITALFHLIEIRFKELQLTADPVVLEEVRKQINNLQAEAEEQQFYEVLVNTYRLQSQLALLELDAERAIALLVKTRTLAEEKDLKRIIPSIMKEQEKLESQLGMWEKLKEENAPLVETLKQVPLEDDVKRITRETALEVRGEQTGEIIKYRKLFSLRF